MPQLSLPSLVDMVSTLPPFQRVMEQCMATLQKPYSSARELGRWIESDLALSGRVMSLANSSFYGALQRVLSPSQAVVVVGRRALEETFFSIYIQGLFTSQGDAETSAIWHHSLSCGLAARELVHTLGLPSAEGADTPDSGAYLAGLLHDSGKLLVLANHPDAYREAARARADKSQPSWEAERGCWGFDHGELGEAMARKWGLQEEVCEAIRWHHEPGKASLSPELTALVHLGDLMAQGESMGGDIEHQGLAQASPAAIDALGLSDGAVARLEEVRRGIREKMRFYDHLLQSPS